MEVSIDYLEERGEYIREAMSKSILDAAFLCHYYNNFHKKWGPGEKPADIMISEVFPSISSELSSSVIWKSEKMFHDANQPAMARLGYSEINVSYEKALSRFKYSNPDFTDGSYDLALHAAMVNNR